MNSSNPSIADDIRTYISTELIIGTMAIDDNQELLMSGLLDSINVMPVSYTHLTLPTILRV